MIKNGTRLKSQVDDTQVIVVKASETLDDLRCGGVPMVELHVAVASAQPAAGLAEGTLMGKRYVDDSGAEVLVTKAGVGTLTAGDALLVVKEAKPLPASD